jgi:HAD superfamily hydrolase (TIGR01484 family)
MNHLVPDPVTTKPPPILATDLDGTLIPLASTNGVPRQTIESRQTTDSPWAADRGISPAECPQRQALTTLSRLADADKLEIIFVTGRHHDSVMNVMNAEGLPVPRWIICDVGTTLLCRADRQRYLPSQAYVNHLDAIVGRFDTGQLAQAMAGFEGLVLQEPEKQGRHKLSFYCDRNRIDGLVTGVAQRLGEVAAPYRIVSSVDPFNGDGLIDLLPLGTDKSTALAWWAERSGYEMSRIVFSGDSGNDYAALTSGFRAILVGNADRKLARRVVDHHRQVGTEDRIYIAQSPATAGVLEGCVWFGLVDP